MNTCRTLDRSHLNHQNQTSESSTLNLKRFLLLRSEFDLMKELNNSLNLGENSKI